MRWLPALDEGFRDRLLAQDDATCGPWLDSVSGICEDVARGWQLSRAGPPAYGGTSIVLPVTTHDDQPAVLKLVSPIADAQAEHRMLVTLDGHGAVEVHDADLEHSALLLEQVTGPTLAEETDRVGPLGTASFAGSVARRIAVVPAPHDAPQLADGAERWLAQFEAQHDTARHVGIALDAETFAAAVDGVERLGRTRSATLTHGDLSVENIMRRSDGPWIAIDPDFLAGPVEHEAHTILRSLLTSIVASSNPITAMADAARAFCSASGADPGLALDISHARFAASYYWEAQHKGDPENVENLRVATWYAAELRRRHARDR